MGLVTLAALCVAAFAILFRYFERYRVALLPAIAVNYTVAFACGLIAAPTGRLNDANDLLLPASLIGILFVLIFTLAGLSAQRAGAARTTIAGRMSLVLTITGTLLLFHERIEPITVVGIALALIGLVLTTATGQNNGAGQGQWLLPMLLFLCSGAADIGFTYTQRTLAQGEVAAILPTLCFGASTVVSVLLLLVRREHGALRQTRTWIGGVVLGMVNYASLVLLVHALNAGTHPAAVIFPVMNILAILIATAAGIILFKERLSARQWSGILLCLASLSLIMSATT
ncbi:MAG: hypothetical protein E6Q44_13015 [Flavobacteriales bacterium]|jgi:drug/metabolite transporter (DMT)-like permease|nr:MAG: hypothetical protein E6Q44_13015 [Flavobacteriales bacterium]